MDDLSAETGAGDVAPPSGDGTDAAVQVVSELFEAGDFRAVTEVVKEALGPGGNSPELLWMLADAEFADDNLTAGSAAIARAMEACGHDAGGTARQIETMDYNGLWREGLRAVERIPAGMRGDLLVREAAGNFYRRRGCPAHAAQSYGQPDDLDRRVRVVRFSCWLRSGGPSARIRRRSWALEEGKLLAWLRRRIRYADQLNEVPSLPEPDALRMRIEIEQLNYRLRQRGVRWHAVTRRLYLLLPALTFVVWLALLTTIHLYGSTSARDNAATGAALSAVIATVPIVVLFWLFFRSDWQPRFSLRLTTRKGIVLFFIPVVAQAALVAGYGGEVFPSNGQRSWLALGIAAMPVILAFVPAVIFFADGIWSWRMRKVIRENCQLILLDVLLQVLDDLRTPECHPLAQRLDQAAALEFVARRFTRGLLPASRLAYLGSGDWLARRAAGWAEALRYIQRQIVAPVPGSWPKTHAALRHEIRCLATGDLGALAWRQPPPRPTGRAIVWRQAISVSRTILVAGLPLAAVLGTQSLLHANPGIFGWARIAAGIWALLYVVLTLDPTIRDKIDTVNEIAGVLRSTRPSDRA